MVENVMRAHNPRKILVTGGCGFIGINFIKFMLNEHPNVEIINIDNHSIGCVDQYHRHALRKLDRYTRHNADLTDDPNLDAILRKHEPDTVVHFAAISHVDRSIDNPAGCVHNNVMSTARLVEAVTKLWGNDPKNHENYRFHHVSTDEVYGSLGESEPATTENSLYKPRSPYAASKAASDHIVKAYGETFELPWTMSHCTNNFGPYQHKEKFIPTIIRACINNKPIPIYGNGLNQRDWLFVDEHCAAIDRIICYSDIDEVYNISGINPWTNIELVLEICNIMDQAHHQEGSYRNLITFVEDRVGHDYRYDVDIGKIAKLIQWRPSMKRTFRDELVETITWYLTEEERIKQIHVEEDL